MSDAQPPVRSRGFTSVDLTRFFISLVVLLIASACYWLTLPLVQSLIIPSAPGGKDGPWVLRPDLGIHFGAVAMMACATFPLITWPLRRIWTRADAASGTRYDPYSGRPGLRVLFAVKALLIMAVYAVALLFYLFSWTVIGSDGIEERRLWTKVNYSFQDISSLETIPFGERSDSIKKEGPWYSVKFKDGHSIEFNSENEGTTPDELTAMTAFIAQHTRVKWTRRSDARPAESQQKGGGGR